MMICTGTHKYQRGRLWRGWWWRWLWCMDKQVNLWYPTSSAFAITSPSLICLFQCVFVCLLQSFSRSSLFSISSSSSISSSFSWLSSFSRYQSTSSSYLSSIAFLSDTTFLFLDLLLIVRLNLSSLKWS